MNPILSICIPTYNRLDILRNTISSIYSDLESVNLEDFEVVISDNSKDSTQPIVEEFNYDNLHYYITECEGFLNSFHAMSYGKGAYIKLNNNYTKFRKGSLKKIIKELKQYKRNKTQVIYTNGLRQKKNIKQYDSLDEYILGLSYFCSWSAGYGMWKEDLDKVKNSVQLDSFFPQTSLLLTQDYKKSFAINDRVLFEDQHVPKKGGYNIFEVFCVDFLVLINKAYHEGKISEQTYRKVKSDLLYKYLSVRYFKTVIAKLDNFEKTDIKKSIITNYTVKQYYCMLIVALFAPVINLIRKIRLIVRYKNEKAQAV